MSNTVATSLKLPLELKAAIDEDAKKQGVSSHAWMLKSLADVRSYFVQLAAHRAGQAERSVLAGA